MSCHSTSGGIVSTSLARAITGLNEKEVQHIFHALKRESQGMASPSELDVREWRTRQYDLLSRMRKMSDSRRDKLRDRLFRSRSESVPDGATFHAWKTIEARARQEVALRNIDTAIDLEPPGSQAHLYELGEDGRPKKVWYASYGSNLHRDRFMNYIEGGSPEGSTRHYDGCTDKTPPENDIPIRFAGARPHFALTSRVWHGGIAFIDAQKGESAQGLGRAYEINITQFDEVVAQENGLDAKWASPVPLKEVLTTGRSVIGNGSYETILHIGDYEGAPVLTFTAPFSTREALTRSGHILRTPVGQKTPIRMPVMTNKPSPAYLRMIGGGLQETFGMDEVQQADYLRGCPGGDRWTRQQMVRILRGETPDPPREPGPENPATKNTDKTTGKGKSKGKPTDKERIDAAVTAIRTPGTATGAWTPGSKPHPTGGLNPTATFSHKDTGNGQAAVQAADGAILEDLREKGLFPASDLTPGKSKGKGKGAPASRSGAERKPTPQEIAEWRSGQISTADLAKRVAAQPGSPRKGPYSERKQAQRDKQTGKGSATTTPTTGSGTVRVRRDADNNRVLPRVKTYPSIEEQHAGITRWTNTLAKHTKERDSIQNSVNSLARGAKTQLAEGAPPEHLAATHKNLMHANDRLNEANALVAQASVRLTEAKNQRPTRYYTPKNRTLAEWKDEDSRLVTQQRATELALDAAVKSSSHDAADRLRDQLNDLDFRLQEIHEIVTGWNKK